jgi:hypothetical protein
VCSSDLQSECLARPLALSSAIFLDPHFFLPMLAATAEGSFTPLRASLFASVLKRFPDPRRGFLAISHPFKI